ncbi:type II toxin-antitoxin system PrlF family antitoxin [Legionella israelensis]|uniref:Type II toxin-antitoxin system PrlF family antitoxin n=1 Tax=Legionella israelensis TaxID=454 RepID=A0AAX1EFC1_9GAMM|nr:type II toxin-antitoxin system PrlF family antitoxin [Legionella israelensis]QBR83788.1 type II toxin-antitoxin system PrlF family antitoxin [Legionella israelensis]
MNNSIIVSESTLTDRYQTTVPEPIRKALHLNKRAKIRYTIQSDGSVVLSRADNKDVDPVLSGFLNFLAADISKHPTHLKTVSPDLVSHVSTLVSGVDVNLDEPLLDGDD